MTHNPVVAVVILNWNQPELTKLTVQSLQRSDYPCIYTILVDNGSESLLSMQYDSTIPRTVFLKFPHNLGFTGGCNAAIQQALEVSADYILLLNNDTELHSSMISRLVEFASQKTSLGIVGPLISYYDSPTTVWFAGGEVNSATGQVRSIFDGCSNDCLAGPLQVDYVSGCSLMIKREVVERVGLLDDRFFAYYEEVDWCARVQEAGYEVWVLPQAQMWHKIQMKTRNLSPWYVYLMTRNRFLYLSNRGATPYRIMQVLISQELPLILGWTLRSNSSAGKRMAYCKALGIFDFLRMRYGRPSFSQV